MKRFVTIEEIAAALGITVEAAKERAAREAWPYVERRPTHIRRRPRTTCATRRQARHTNH